MNTYPSQAKILNTLQVHRIYFENENNIDIMDFKSILTDVILEILFNLWCEGFGSMIKINYIVYIKITRHLARQLVIKTIIQITIYRFKLLSY